MSDNSPQTGRSLSLDEFIALNDEIGSLLKAGVPLDVGMSGYAYSVSGRLSRVSKQVADAISRGETLENAFESAQTQMPIAYRAILEAGAASGRLPEAVESLSDHARRLTETRRQFTLALIYPTIVFLLAWCLFWSFVTFIAPKTLELSRSAADRDLAWMTAAEKTAEVFRYIGPIPLVVLGGFLIWLVLPTRGTSRQGILDMRGIRWLPGSRKARRAWSLSSFADISSKLLEHGVPEPRALQLAANTTHDRALVSDAETISEAIRNGESAAARIDAARTLPPFAKWMWKAAEQQSALIPAFQNLSEHYRRQAERAITRMQLLFPILLTVVVAGGVVAVYGLAIFSPIAELMLNLSQENL